MHSNLAIVKSMADEHEAIRAHMESLRRSLEGGGSYSIAEKTQSLADLQKEIQLAVGYLEDGIKNHYAHEETVMPPLLGEALMRAVVLEHREIQRRLDSVKSLITEANPSMMSQEDYEGRASRIGQIVNSICDLIEAHSLKEDTMLDLLRTVL